MLGYQACDVLGEAPSQIKDSLWCKDVLPNDACWLNIYRSMHRPYITQWNLCMMLARADNSMPISMLTSSTMLRCLITKHVMSWESLQAFVLCAIDQTLHVKRNLRDTLSGLPRLVYDLEQICICYKHDYDSCINNLVMDLKRDKEQLSPTMDEEGNFKSCSDDVIPVKTIVFYIVCHLVFMFNRKHSTYVHQVCWC